MSYRGVVSSPDQPPTLARRRAAAARSSVPARSGAALFAGLLLWLAFPGSSIGWLAPVGVALLYAAVDGARPRLAFGLGLLGGLAFFLPTLSWSGIFVGRLPWFALATLEALYIALMCLVTVAVQRPLRRTRLAAAAPLVVPLAWVLQETARSTTPFGGFPWARLAFSQADTPLADLARYGGAPLVTFAVALLGAGAYTVLRSARTPELRPALVTGIAAVLVAGGSAGAAAVAGQPTDGPTADVLAVQGNVPRAGLDFNAERRLVLDNHVAGTLRRQDQWAATPPDVVIWPENASDIDPVRNADANAVIRAAVNGAHAPILVGAVLQGPGDKISNASLLFRPQNDVLERYIKQHPVPFAEYIPYRSFFRTFSDKVDYVTKDFAQGTTQGGFEISTKTPGRSFWVIPTICFEVAYDGLMRDAVTQDGRSDSIIAVQTNNATFGYSDESEQQLAISRIRAIEHGRSIVHISTVGVSGFIAPDGTVTQRTELFTAADLLAQVTIRSDTTVADRSVRRRSTSRACCCSSSPAQRSCCTGVLGRRPPEGSEQRGPRFGLRRLRRST